MLKPQFQVLKRKRLICSSVTIEVMESHHLYSASSRTRLNTERMNIMIYHEKQPFMIDLMNIEIGSIAYTVLVID